MKQTTGNTPTIEIEETWETVLADVLDERQLRLVKNSLNYRNHDPAGLPGHQLMLIIGKIVDVTEKMIKNRHLQRNLRTGETGYFPDTPRPALVLIRTASELGDPDLTYEIASYNGKKWIPYDEDSLLNKDGIVERWRYTHECLIPRTRD